MLEGVRRPAEGKQDRAVSGAFGDPFWYVFSGVVDNVSVTVVGPNDLLFEGLVFGGSTLNDLSPHFLCELASPVEHPGAAFCTGLFNSTELEDSICAR
jgi:hypothetical protein